MFAFLLAIVLIFLVLSAQFESFKDPIIVMMTVPLALTGALVFMWYFNVTLNIFSQIGIIMLIGLVSKNGILIVEFANQRKLAGMSKLDAIRYASAARFRPILMTSLSTILGILPLAMGLVITSYSIHYTKLYDMPLPTEKASTWKKRSGRKKKKTNNEPGN